MYVLIIVHSEWPDENEYYGPFDTEEKADAFFERLAAEATWKVRADGEIDHPTDGGVSYVVVSLSVPAPKIEDAA